MNDGEYSAILREIEKQKDQILDRVYLEQKELHSRLRTVEILVCILLSLTGFLCFVTGFGPIL